MASQMEQMLGAIGGMRGGRSFMEETAPFLVKMKSPADRDETVFAHTYEIVDGALQFITMKAKDVDVPGEGGQLVKRTAIYQTFPKAFAPGVWATVEPVFVPPMDAAKIGN